MNRHKDYYTDYNLFANFLYERRGADPWNENPYELWGTFEGGAVKAECFDNLGVKIDSEGRFSAAELVRKLGWEDLQVDDLLEEGYIESEDELVTGIEIRDYYYLLYRVAKTR